MRRNIPEVLLHTIDTLNTIHGGVTQAIVASRKFDDHLEYKVTVPGTDLEHFRLQINQQQLLVINEIAGGQSGKITRVATALPLFNFVDHEQITSFHNGRELIVHMPFNSLAGEHVREIDIQPI
jgi:hypothetical protein